MNGSCVFRALCNDIDRFAIHLGLSLIDIENAIGLFIRALSGINALCHIFGGSNNLYRIARHLQSIGSFDRTKMKSRGLIETCCYD